jgi:DcuC family C4-dicarboxylate transporter
MLLPAGLLVIGLAAFAIVRRAEVRLTLLLAALALGALAGRPEVIVQTFFIYFTREQFLVPIGCCLGFVYVLRQTQCDQHLVQLLAAPLRHVRWLLIPGVVLVAALVNVPVISQLSTAVLSGTVLVPLLRAAGISPVTTGAALLLGASIGGELLNPGAPELRSVGEAAGAPTVDCVRHVLPLLLVQLAVATPLFWLLSLRAERRYAAERGGRSAGERPPAPSEGKAPAREGPPGKDGSQDVPLAVEFRINLLKAAVPVIPLVLLFLTSLPPPLRVFDVPRHVLVDVKDQSPQAVQSSFDSRLIGAAMLVGTAVAALTDWRRAGQTARAFFEGAGYALTHITSLIVAATCFGKGVELIGLAGALGGFLENYPGLLRPAAVVMPWAFALLCGSGMASTQSLYGFFVAPARALGADPLQLGAMVSLSAAAGRTMSPVAAVVLMCSSLTGANPLHLARRVAVPLLAGLLAVLAAAMLVAR